MNARLPSANAPGASPGLHRRLVNPRPPRMNARPRPVNPEPGPRTPGSRTNTRSASPAHRKEARPMPTPGNTWHTPPPRLRWLACCLRMNRRAKLESIRHRRREMVPDNISTRMEHVVYRAVVVRFILMCMFFTVAYGCGVNGSDRGASMQVKAVVMYRDGGSKGARFSCVSGCGATHEIVWVHIQDSDEGGRLYLGGTSPDSPNLVLPTPSDHIVLQNMLLADTSLLVSSSETEIWDHMKSHIEDFLTSAGASEISSRE